MNEYQKIYDAIIEGDEDKALEEAKTLLAQGVRARSILLTKASLLLWKRSAAYTKKRKFLSQR